MDSIKMELMKDGEKLVVNAPPIRNYTCPYCGSSEGTMLSRDEEKVLFTCFRAKCPKNGSMVIPLDGQSFKFKGGAKRVFKPTIYEDDVANLEPSDLEFLHTKFAIDARRYNIKKSIGHNRYMIPMYTILGTRWGWGARSYDKSIDKKFILYCEVNAPRLYFPPIGVEKWRDADTVVIVEDVVSAMKVSEHLPAVSILGTSLNTEQVKTLTSNFDNVIIWLDYDTWQPPKSSNIFWLPKPRELKKKIDLFFNQVSCICSREDPKDLTHKEIKEYLIEIIS